MLHPASKLAAMLRPRSHRFALESRQLFDGAALVSHLVSRRTPFDAAAAATRAILNGVVTTSAWP